MLVGVIITFRSVVSNSCKLWKADIDSAYRRIPARASERWALWVAFLVDGKPFAAGHNAMPFGSIGSVHGWDRIGSLFRHLGRRLLSIPLLRYVDDYFSVDTEELAAHAMTCFARVVRALLGAGAVGDSKLEAAMPLVVLGLQVTATNKGVEVVVSKKKAVQWWQMLEAALASGVLAAGDASKVAGRLSFAAQHTFLRLGRAMLRPLFAQQYASLPQGRIGPMLRLAMQWWQEVLKQRRCQTVPWAPRSLTSSAMPEDRPPE